MSNRPQLPRDKSAYRPASRAAGHETSVPEVLETCAHVAASASKFTRELEAIGVSAGSAVLLTGLVLVAATLRSR